MSDHLVERQLLTGAQAEGELAVVVGGLDAEEGGGHGQDSYGGPLGGQAPQSDGSLLADFGVGREVLHGQNVKSGKELRAVAIIGHKQVEKAIDGFGKVLGLFIAIYYNHQGTPGGLP